MLQDLSTSNNYISIVDGSDYQGEIPSTVRIPASRDVDGLTVTEWLTATIGDENYKDVLESWMFEHGYVRKVDKSRPYALVVMKGGVGSGFHGHKGRPGEVGGSLPEGSAAVVKLREPVIIGADSESTAAKMREELKRYAEELGFPADKIVYVEGTGYAFKVGDSSYESAAQFDPKTGQITLYSGSQTLAEFTDSNGVTTNFDKKIIAHEVMHSRFHEFERQLHRQEAQINKLTTGMEDNPVLDDHYDLKPEFREQYWAVDIKQRYYQYGDMRELLYQLPVSDYGKSYVEVARKSIYGVDISRALSENLSEVAAYSSSSSKFISKRWADLYNEINQGLYAHKLIPKYVPLVRATGSLGLSNQEN